MNVTEAIEIRRAYRSLEPVEITEDLIKDLASHASLSASCFNYQPWRYIFVYELETLKEVFTALSKTNVWAHDASMIIAVLSRPDLDCIVRGKEYYLFDTGMATAFLILRATELGLVAHPIAGFREKRVKRILGVPDDMTVITLVIVGKHADTIKPVLTDSQKEMEKKRPERMPLEEFIYINRFKDGQ
jgi:nitroreductase